MGCRIDIRVDYIVDVGVGVGGIRVVCIGQIGGTVGIVFVGRIEVGVVSIFVIR